MRYIDTDKLVAEIERRKKSIDECPFIEAELGASIKRDAKIKTFNELISLITSLQQEQPDVDLEKEICEYFEGWRINYYSETEELLNNIGCAVDFDDVKTIARHFYELGLKAKKGE